MRFFDKLSWRKKRLQLQAQTKKIESLQAQVKTLTIAGRTSSRSDVFSLTATTYLPRQWREYHYKDLEGIQTWSTERLLSIFIDINPETSAAVTNYLRVFDSGLSFEVKKANGDPHKEGSTALQDILRRLKQISLVEYTSPKGIRSMSLSHALDGLLKGAIACEAVFDKDYNLQDIVLVDPWTVSFKWEKGREIPYQNNTGMKGETSLDIPTFFYIPVDPLGDDPYGRSALISAIRPILFKMRVMQDLERVIHNQGYPRITVEVLEEVLIENARKSDPTIVNDPAKLTEYINDRKKEIENEYKNISPDASIVHTDSMKLGYLETSGGGKNMFAPKELLDVIDSQIVNGLKTVASLLSKRFGGSTEGYTSVEATIFLNLIRGYQNIVTELYDQVFTLALKVENNFMDSEVISVFEEPHLRADLDTAVYRSTALSNLERVPLTDSEYTERSRKLIGVRGAPPEGEEVRLHPNDSTSKENQPERPAEAEDEKEEKRKESNRRRRSGED